MVIIYLIVFLLVLLKSGFVKAALATIMLFILIESIRD